MRETNSSTCTSIRTSTKYFTTIFSNDCPNTGTVIATLLPESISVACTFKKNGKNGKNNRINIIDKMINAMDLSAFFVFHELNSPRNNAYLNRMAD
ncbi:MAG: hypothetical protein WB502_01935 [Thermoactinomyces sp.]